VDEGVVDCVGDGFDDWVEEFWEEGNKGKGFAAIAFNTILPFKKTEVDPANKKTVLREEEG